MRVHHMKLSQIIRRKFIRFMRFFIATFVFTIININASYSAVCNNEADKIIKLYNLKPLEFEGGYFKQTYKLESYDSDKIPKATAILFLLKTGDKSRMHKLFSDEIYHFYEGDPIRMLQLNPDGTSHTIILGKDIAHGQQLQVIVPKDTWQGSSVIDGGCYALVGTTMTPGFDISEFQLGKRNELIKKYPQDKDIINYLTG